MISSMSVDMSVVPGPPCFSAGISELLIIRGVIQLTQILVLVVVNRAVITIKIQTNDHTTADNCSNKMSTTVKMMK